MPPGRRKQPPVPQKYLEYREKCLKQAKTEEDRQFVSKFLADKVSKLKKQGKFYLTSWNFMPVPKMPSMKSGNFNSAAAAAVASNPITYPPAAAAASTTTLPTYPQTNPYSQWGTPQTATTAAPASDFQQEWQQYFQKEKAQYQAQSASHLSNNVKRKRDQITANTGSLHSNLRGSKRVRNANHGNSYSSTRFGALSSENTKKKSKSKYPGLPSLADMKPKPLVGTCRELEKDYVRLTEETNPALVRPQHILEKTLKLLKHKYLKEKAEYTYMCNQLKSMRQDLTVQCIQNTFTVRVYESHARIALQNDDLNQFNQCQSQLKMLYAKGLPGNRAEFTAYRLMYYAFVKNFASLTADLRELSEETKQDSHIKYAMRVIKAVNGGNVYRIFGTLYETAPKMSSDLIQVFADGLREDYLFVLGKSHTPTKLSSQFLQKMLGLRSRRDFNALMKKYNLPEGEEMYSSKMIAQKIREHRANRKKK